VSPDINALATILVLIVTIGVAILGTLMMRRDKRRARDAQAAIAANT
jgi:putrescine transport system permease protein